MNINLNVSTKEVPLFETFSWYKAFRLLIFRFILLVVIFVAFINFNENPVVTSIAMAICVFLFLWVGQAVIEVYKDRFQYKWGSLIKIFNLTDTYYYKDIKSISIDGIFTLTYDVIDDIFLDSPLFRTRNRINLEFHDGNKKSINAYVYKGDLKKALQYILEHYKIYYEKNQKQKR